MHRIQYDQNQRINGIHNSNRVLNEPMETLCALVPHKFPFGKSSYQSWAIAGSNTLNHQRSPKRWKKWQTEFKLKSPWITHNNYLRCSPTYFLLFGESSYLNFATAGSISLQHWTWPQRLPKPIMEEMTKRMLIICATVPHTHFLVSPLVWVGQWQAWYVVRALHRAWRRGRSFGSSGGEGSPAPPWNRPGPHPATSWRQIGCFYDTSEKLQIFTEHQKKFLTSSEWHSLKFPASKLIWWQISYKTP